VVPETWNEVKELVLAVESGEIKCETLVLDSVTEMENMAHKELFGSVGIDAWEKGYGRGDTLAIMHWRELLNSLERVWGHGKGVVLVAHAQIRRHEDPLGGAFDRYEIAARSKLAGLLKSWPDYVLFAKEEVVLQPTKSGVSKAATTGVRYAFTRQSPAYDAKARGTNMFPERLLLSWDDFMTAVKADQALDERAKELQREIDTMLAEIGDKKLEEVVHGYVRDNPGMLAEARNRVAARLEEARVTATKPPAPTTAPTQNAQAATA
jgi:hypothetical protein